jgi:hypothetical protein
MKKTRANKKGHLVRQGQGALIRVAALAQLYGLAAGYRFRLNPPTHHEPAIACGARREPGVRSPRARRCDRVMAGQEQEQEQGLAAWRLL